VRQRLLIAIPILIALGATAIGAARSRDTSGSGNPLGSVTAAEVVIPLSVYLVHEAGATDGVGLSSRRTEEELLDIAPRSAPSGPRPE